MNKLFFLSLFIISGHISLCQRSDIEYNFDCLNENISGSIISFFGDIEAEVLEDVSEEVSIDEEIEIGDKLFDWINENYIIDYDNPLNSKLNNILGKLVSSISNPKGFNYKIYILDTTELNAFTCGGRIYYSTEMLSFCESDDEIAAIVGHEIGHNELGHINNHLKRLKAAQIVFGETGGGVFTKIGETMTVSFNQKNEVHCDMFGVDLSILSRYDGCESIEIWNRMHEKYKNEEAIPRFILSHPYSSDRSECLINHISNNYSTECR